MIFKLDIVTGDGDELVVIQVGSETLGSLKLRGNKGNRLRKFVEMLLEEAGATKALEEFKWEKSEG